MEAMREQMMGILLYCKIELLFVFLFHFYYFFAKRNFYDNLLKHNIAMTIIQMISTKY